GRADGGGGGSDAGADRDARAAQQRGAHGAGGGGGPGGRERAGEGVLGVGGGGVAGGEHGGEVQRAQPSGVAAAHPEARGAASGADGDGAGDPDAGDEAAMSEGRRVRSVRLRAATPALVQRGALLLEDALRTASMPDPGRGRVLFIRSLAVGTIRPDRSSSSLALALERRVRALASTAMHAEEEVAEAAGIGAPGAMGAWFWPLVVPEAWGKPRDEALRAVLRAALEAEPGPAAAVALVEGLVERGAVAPLLGALRWSDGPGLARAFWGLAP